MTLSVSVIICTHNPRVDHLGRVLSALRSQTLPISGWELLLIDNASRITVSNQYDLSWQPNGRHIREESVGLTAARLRGIGEARGKLLVFVDDDNVLDPDYLAVALDIGEAYPFLGVWGGSVIPEFEVPPPKWAAPYLLNLALRECHRDVWGNSLILNETCPNGAGMCIRQEAAAVYLAAARENSIHQRMDRRGTDLTGFGDHALVFVVCLSGYGSGRMARLRLTHLIPSVRLTEAYLSKLMERTEYSQVHLDFIVTGELPPIEPTVGAVRRLVRWVRRLRLPPAERRISAARLRGRREGIEAVRRLVNGAADGQPECPKV